MNYFYQISPPFYFAPDIIKHTKNKIQQTKPNNLQIIKEHRNKIIPMLLNNKKNSFKKWYF